MSEAYLNLMGSPYIMLTEWVPLAVNNVAQLMEKLEALEGKSCIVTDQVDKDPESTIFEMNPSRFKVSVIRYKVTDYIELIANIDDFTAPSSDVVCEDGSKEMGIHVDASGRISYGIRLAESKGEVERHSLDSVSRIISNLNTDTSKLMDVMLSNYQRRLLELIYYNESIHRDKFTTILASGIDPGIGLDELLSNPAYHGELRQIVNVIDEGRSGEINEEEYLILGTNGGIVVSADPRKYEKVMYFYSLLKGIEATQNNTFARIGIAWDEINGLQKKFRTKGMTHRDREEIAELMGNISLLEAILTYIKKSLAGIDEEMPVLLPNMSEDERALMDMLEIDDVLSEIRLRIDDAYFVLEDLEKEVNGLSTMASTLHEGELRKVFGALRENTAHSVAIGRALEMLEALIFGVYFIEVMNFIIIYSNGEDWLKVESWIPGVSRGAFLIVFTGVVTIYLAWKLINYMHNRTFEKIKKRIS